MKSVLMYSLVVPALLFSSVTAEAGRRSASNSQACAPQPNCCFTILSYSDALARAADADRAEAANRELTAKLAELEEKLASVQAERDAAMTLSSELKTQLTEQEVVAAKATEAAKAATEKAEASAKDAAAQKAAAEKSAAQAKAANEAKDAAEKARDQAVADAKTAQEMTAAAKKAQTEAEAQAAAMKKSLDEANAKIADLAKQLDDAKKPAPEPEPAKKEDVPTVEETPAAPAKPEN